VARALTIQPTCREKPISEPWRSGAGARGLATGRNEDLSLPAANSREIPWQSRRAKRVSNEIDSRDLAEDL